MSQDAARSKSRFMMGMEHVLREINHEIISPAIPDMSVENAVPLMITVARLRAEYLKYAFKLSADRTDQHPTEEELAKLKSWNIASTVVISICRFRRQNHS